jgi:hypothetical protein
VVLLSNHVPYLNLVKIMDNLYFWIDLSFGEPFVFVLFFSYSPISVHNAAGSIYLHKPHVHDFWLNIRTDNGLQRGDDYE